MHIPPWTEHFLLTRFFLGILTRSQGKQSEVVIVVVIGVIVVGGGGVVVVACNQRILRLDITLTKTFLCLFVVVIIVVVVVVVDSSIYEIFVYCQLVF